MGERAPLRNRGWVRGQALGLAVLLLWAWPAVARQIVENPKTPPSPNAGRILALKEVSRITDVPGKFLFAQPLEVFAGRDGSVYVQEYTQLLKFDSEGKFVRNLLKRGQGPGEVADNLTDVVVRKDDILLYSSNSLKLVRVDRDGKLLEDRSFAETPFSKLLGLYAGKYLFLKRERAAFPKVSGFFEANLQPVIVPEKGRMIETPYPMAVTEAVHFGSKGVSISSISRVMPVSAGDREVFLFHSPGYLIERVDLETGKVLGRFRREYERVRYDAEAPKGYPAELIPKYHNDLCRLLWRGDKLWAVTSTFDAAKGILVDVFNREGKYLDDFYLPLLKIRRNNPQYYAPMAVYGDFLYLLEADEDDFISLVKYEIKGE